MSDTTVYLTQDDAALRCGCSKDTIRRYRRKGELPNSRTRLDGVVEVSVADLVAAGLLDPLAATADVAAIVERSRTERDLVVARQEVATLAADLKRADGEIAFLRSVIANGRLAS